MASDPEGSVTEACQRSLRIFIEEAWPYMVPAEPFQPNWHIDAMCEHLEAVKSGQIDNLLINIPPRFGKSTVCSVALSSWLWVDDPTLRLIFASYVENFATRDSLATRALIQSPWYQARWGARYELTGDQNEKMHFQTDKKGFRRATSVGGATTGEGGDWIVVDDPHNAKEAQSETKLETVRFWWNNVMPSRTGRLGRAKRVIIMQRIHEKDLASEVEGRPGWTHLNLPMEYEKKMSKITSIGWRDPREAEGELLWPKRFDKKFIDENLRPPHMSSVAYASQFQQRPAPAEGGMFLRKWWRYHKLDALSLIEKSQDRCWSWDCAFKDLKDSDFVCGLAWVRIAADFYLLPHRVHDRLTFGATKMAVKSCAAKWPKIHYKLVEDKANGTAVIDDLNRTVGGLRPIEPEGGKVARAFEIQAYVEAGNVYLPDPSIAPWVEDFVEEFRVFPNGANDDYVDATTQAINWMLSRMSKSFPPIVTTATKSWTSPDRGEHFRDPREVDETIVVGYSERGDMPRRTR